MRLDLKGARADGQRPAFASQQLPDVQVLDDDFRSSRRSDVEAYPRVARSAYGKWFAKTNFVPGHKLS
jgi:hypothetical protein